MCSCACANNTRSGKMVSMNTWPSVSIKRAGSTIISWKVVKCKWSNTLGEIVECVDRNLSHGVVEKVVVSSNAQFLDPVHEFLLDRPVELLKDYGMNVLFYLSGDENPERSVIRTECIWNFDGILLQMSSFPEGTWKPKACKETMSLRAVM